MDRQTVDRALDKFAKSVTTDMEEPQVILYGGEPLLNKPVAMHAVRRVTDMVTAGELPKSTGITLNTNGTLLDEAFLDFL